MFINILLLIGWLFLFIYYIYAYSEDHSKDHLFWIITCVFWIILETVQILNRLIYPIFWTLCFTNTWFTPVSLQTMLILYIVWLLISLFFFISDILHIYKLMYQQKAYEYTEGFISLVLYGFLILYWSSQIYFYAPKVFLLIQTLFTNY